MQYFLPPSINKTGPNDSHSLPPPPAPFPLSALLGRTRISSSTLCVKPFETNSGVRQIPCLVMKGLSTVHDSSSKAGGITAESSTTLYYERASARLRRVLYCATFVMLVGRVHIAESSATYY